MDIMNEEPFPMEESSLERKIRQVGSRFVAKDLGLVRLYLRNMVMKNESSFITVMDMYKAEPWHLDHVQNKLFKKNEWFYFVPRTRKGANSVKRTVPGRGESEGGWWKGTGKKIEILDRKKRLMGYKQSHVYHKYLNGKQVSERTDWLMMEYSLSGDQFQSLVLCWIRDKTEKKVIVDQVPQVENNILSNQVQEETDFANEIEMPMVNGDITQQQQYQDTPIFPLSNDTYAMMMSNQEQYQWNDLTHEQNEEAQLQLQQQQQYQDTPILPPLPQGQDSVFETMMTMQSNDNNAIIMANQEPYEWYDGDLMVDTDEFIRTPHDLTQQNEEAQLQVQQQQYQDTPILPPLPQGLGSGFKTMMTMQSNENNAMITSNQEPYEWEDELKKLCGIL